MILFFFFSPSLFVFFFFFFVAVVYFALLVLAVFVMNQIIQVLNIATDECKSSESKVHSLAGFSDVTVRLRSRFVANSKHWFTASFLQPLPYLVTP